MKGTYTKFAIGDIHGCMKQLNDLVVECLAYCDEEQSIPHFIFLGDYIDRGPQSKQVLTYLQRLPAILDPEAKVTCLRGNHDQMMIDTLLHQDVKQEDVWLNNGGEQTLASYSKIIDRREVKSGVTVREPLLMVHAQWLDTLPLSFEDNWRFYCHAGIRPRVPLDKQGPHDLLWIRDEFLDFPHEHPKFIVHGHTPTRRGPDLKFNRVNLDTGVCFYGGKLTAGVFNDSQAAPVTFLYAGSKVQDEYDLVF
jgi:serine/threonine protein phosphatase 1